MNAFEARYLQLVASSEYIRAVAQPGRPIRSVQYYVYNLVMGTLAVPAQVLALNTDVTSVIETQADSDFVLSYMSAAAQATVSENLFVNRDITIQLQDLSTGKFFFSAPIVMGLVAGAGGFPYVFPSPRVIRPNTGLAVTIRRRDTVNAYSNFFLALHGTRIFYGA
jgi:hypothetical protein